MNLLQKLFCRNVDLDKALYVQVINSYSKKPISTGHIVGYSPVRGTLIIELPSSSLDNVECKEIRFDDICTFNRMRDGRIRMWVKEVQQ